MSESPDAAEMNKVMFMQLVLMLSSSAMQQLGKLVNPLTGKAETHLEAAQATIDVLVMLEAKTQGNLDKDEARFLRTTISTLQMNYVETAASAPAEKPAAAPEAPATPDPAAAPAADPEPKDPKFRKTYG